MLIFKPDKQLLSFLSFNVVDIAHWFTEIYWLGQQSRPEADKIVSRSPLLYSTPDPDQGLTSCFALFACNYIVVYYAHFALAS